MSLPPIGERFPGQTAPERWFYLFIRQTATLAYTLLFRARSFDAHKVPLTGACLLACNHQSHLDPPLVSVGLQPRATHFVAKASLFKWGPFGRFIGALCAIPIKQDGSADPGAIRAVLGRLEQGAAVLVFPEGSRTLTGTLQPFQRGVALLVKRAGCPVVPCAVEGTGDAWKPGRAFPRLWRRRVAVMFGTPIPSEELMAGGPDAALHRLAVEIETLRLRLRARLRASTGGRVPPARVGDSPGIEGEQCGRQESNLHVGKDTGT